MVDDSKLSRQVRQKERAEFAYQIYKIMGPDRSLMKLLEQCTAMGLKISENTLKLYSAKFGWQRRLLEESAADKEKQERVIANQVEVMNARHAHFAQGLMGVALAGVNQLERSMKAYGGKATLDLSVQEIVSLYKAAQTGERLARGQATSRIEIWVDIAGTVVNEFGLIFLAVNAIEDPDKRKEEYIRLSDDMVRRYFTEESRQVVDAKSGSYKVD